MSRVKGAILRVFRRGHPDIAGELKKYCDSKGVDPSDVTAAAVAAWLASDEEEKESLEKAMSARRVGGGGGVGSKDFTQFLETFKGMADAMGGMFKAMNEARSTMSIQSMMSDYKAMATGIQELKKAGSEGGLGSIEDALANAFVNRIFSGMGASSPSSKTKTGTGKVKTVDESKPAGDEKE